MFNIMTDRWLQRRQRSPWRSTKTMGEKKRPQPGTNHGQMLLVCGVREWRQTGLAPQHTARTRTHAPGNNTTRRTARQARARGNAQYRRVALAVLPQPTTMDWNRTDGGGNDDDSRDWRATDGRTADRQTDRLNMIIFFFFEYFENFCIIQATGVRLRNYSYMLQPCISSLSSKPQLPIPNNILERNYVTDFV